MAYRCIAVLLGGACPLTTSTVFYLGATGYIGGSVLVALRDRYTDLSITALVRNPVNFEAVRTVGVTVLQGSYDDLALIEEHSYAHDIVINDAEADDFALVTAILRGTKRRADEEKPRSKFIHTNGVAAFLDDGREGKFDPEGKIWNDNEVADIKAITPKNIHGPVDVRILEAGSEGYVETYIVAPAGILGATRGPTKSVTYFLRYLTDLYIKTKHPIYIGEGPNEYALVQLEDAIDMYLRVFEMSRTPGPPSTTPYERYFIPTSNGVPWKAVATVLGGALARRGVVESGIPQSVSVDDADPSIAFLGANIERIVAGRCRALGWNPKPVSFVEDNDFDLDSALDILLQ